jgi:uncharacterized protein
VLLGILADTHGQAERTAAAVRLLERLGVECFAHCGDVGGAEVIEQLAGRRVWIVCGNTDCPDPPLVRFAQTLGLTVTHTGPARLELAGRHVAVFHGHEALFTHVLDTLVDEGRLPADFGPCDFILHGHTHVARDVALGGTRIINPGALHRALAFSVATLELPAGNVRFWQVGLGLDEPTPYKPPRL